ncbi:hypothetical protein D9M71_396610 [compost metagenome]
MPRRLQVALGQFHQQQLQAGVIEQGEIHRTMQDRPFRAQAHFRQQDRPLVEGMAGMIQALAHLLQMRFERQRRGLAQVMQRQALPGHLGLHALAAVVVHHRAQHRVALYQGVPGLVQLLDVDIGRPGVLDVQVAGSAAIVESRVAPQHIGALHRAQGKRLQRLPGLRAPLRAWRQMDHQCFTLGADALGQGRVQRPLRRAKTQLAFSGPEFDLAFTADVQQVIQAHSTPSSMAALLASSAAMPANVGCR